MVEANAAADGPDAATLPLFYRRPEALTAARHDATSLFSIPDYGFARTAHAIPVAASEMPLAMRSYPIVFVGAQNMPIVITGIRKEQNLFVENDGGWTQPHYIPAYVRRYPFILAGDEARGRLTLCVDVECDRLASDAAVPLLRENERALPLFEQGQPSETTRNALKFCQEFHAGIASTRAMVERIAELGLFAERRSTVTLEGGETLNLTEFRAIDEAAFNMLGDDDFLALRKAGALPLIYCHFASMNSWVSLVHQARMAAAPRDAE